MMPQSCACLSDKDLFEKADPTIVDLGILIGRICQQEPTEETLEALQSVTTTMLGILTSNERVFTKKQMIHVQKAKECFDEFLNRFEGLTHVDIIESARCDYMHLLVGIGDPLAAPWESVYESRERSIFQASTLDVRRWYHNYGLQSKLQYHEPDDHIGIILEFICHTIKHHIPSAVPQADPDTQDCLSSFIQEHFLSWAEDWNECIQSYAQTSYYKTLGWQFVLIAIYLKQYLRN